MIAATEGPSALSARRLANESGTTTAAIYTLFGGMDSLRAALTAQSLEDLGRSQAMITEENSPVERLLALAHAYRTWALEHPNEYRSIFSDALGLAVRRAGEVGERPNAVPTVPITAPDVFLASVDEAWEFSLTPLHRAVVAGIESGDFRGQSGDAGMLTAATWSSLHGTVSLELVGVLDATLSRLGSEVDTTTFFDDALSRLVAGLMSPATARGAHA